MSSDTSPSSELALAGDHHRYPGVRSFREADRGRFFGRHRAAEELLLRVLSVRLLLQFAPSGAGKTSLLNAGLFPRIRPHGYLPVNVRLNQPDESLVQAVGRSLREAVRISSGLKDPVVPHEAADVGSLLAAAELWTEDLRVLTPVIVFDQFEEVFTLRDEAFRRGFATEVGALSRGQRAAAGAGGPAVAPPDVKIIISLREEYLGALEEMTSEIPDLFRERLRLSPLTPKEAREAIVEPARLPGEWSSPLFTFSESCLEGLLDFIDGASDRVRVIEPLTLQLVCRRAEELAMARTGAGAGATPELALEDFGGVPGLERLVHHYYVRELQKLGDRNTRAHAAALFEQGLLDPSGKRLMLEQDEILRVYKLAPATLDALVEGRLLRREPRNESVFYEISHDRLTDVIARHRGARLPWWVKPALAAAVILIAVLSGALFMIVSAKRAADDARIAAETSQRVASDALDVLSGDSLVLPLREAGLSDTLENVLRQAPSLAQVSAVLQARQLRREGELALERSTLAEADQKLTAALAVIDSTHESPAGALMRTERALLLKLQGDVLRDKFRISDAEGRYRESVQTWSTVGSLSTTDRLSAIESRMALASMTQRLGDEAAAEKEFTAAGHDAFEVVKVAYHQIYEQNPDNFLLGRALQIYADAVLSAARVWGQADTLRSGRALALELLRLRPLSAQARLQLGVASAVYGAALMESAAANSANAVSSWRETRLLLDESSRQFRELMQLDPRNRRLSRERAAVQLLTAQLLGMCAKAPGCRRELRPGEIESAATVAQHSTGQFEELAAQDPENMSLQDDIAWGKRAQAELRQAQQLGGATDLIDEAIAIRQSLSAIDPLDLTGRVDQIWMTHVKAQALGAQGRVNEALDVVEASLKAADQLPRESWQIKRRYDGLSVKADLLSKAKRQAAAAAARAQLDQLGAKYPDDANVRTDQGVALLTEGIALYNKAKGLKDAEQRSQFGAAAGKFRESLVISPGSVNNWEWLRLACLGQTTGLADSNGQLLAADGTGKETAEASRRCQVESSWMVWVLSAGAPASQERLSALETLYTDRRDLAMFLRYDDAHKQEALIIAEQGVRDAEELFMSEPARFLFLVVDAHYGLGLMRGALGHAGWDASLRVALARGEQLAQREPKVPSHRILLATMRGQLASQLEAAKRGAAAAQERRLAERDCRQALALARTPADRESAQSCLDDLSP